MADGCDCEDNLPPYLSRESSNFNEFWYVDVSSDHLSHVICV